MPDYTVTLTDEQVDAIRDRNPRLSIYTILQDLVTTKAKSEVFQRAENIMQKVLSGTPLTSKEKSLLGIILNKASLT